MEKIPGNLGNFFPNLINLNITKANLRIISKEDFKSLKKLQILTLDFTKIQELPGKLFEFTPNVKEINIQNSLINFVNFHTFDGLNSLETLKFNSTCAVETNSRKIQNLIDEIISKCTEIDKIFCFFETNQKTHRYMCRIKNYVEGDDEKTSVIGKLGKTQ